MSYRTEQGQQDERACGRLAAAIWTIVICVPLAMWLMGCGPRVVQPPIPAGVQWVVPSQTEGQLEAEMQVPPVYQGPQRVFIHRWLVPGGRNNPAPIGYIDLP